MRYRRPNADLRFTLAASWLTGPTLSEKFVAACAACLLYPEMRDLRPFSGALPRRNYRSIASQAKTFDDKDPGERRIPAHRDTDCAAVSAGSGVGRSTGAIYGRAGR